MLGILATLLAFAVEILKRILHILLVPYTGLVVPPRRQVIVDRHIAVLARPLLARDPHVRHGGQCRSYEGLVCRRSDWQSRIRDKRRQDGHAALRLLVARRRCKECGGENERARNASDFRLDPALSHSLLGAAAKLRDDGKNAESDRQPTWTHGNRSMLPCSSTNTRIRPLHRQHLPAPRPSCPSCPRCTRSHLAVRLRNSHLPRRIAAPSLNTTFFLSTILELPRPLLAR